MLSLLKCRELANRYEENIIFMKHMLLVQSCKDYEAWNSKQDYCPITYNIINIVLEQDKLDKVKRYAKKNYDEAV